MTYHCGGYIPGVGVGVCVCVCAHMPLFHQTPICLVQEWTPMRVLRDLPNFYTTSKSFQMHTVLNINCQYFCPILNKIVTTQCVIDLAIFLLFSSWSQQLHFCSFFKWTHQQWMIFTLWTCPCQHMTWYTTVVYYSAETDEINYLLWIPILQIPKFTFHPAQLVNFPVCSQSPPHKWGTGGTAFLPA